MPEKRIVLKNCGLIDPGKISTFRERDGFQGLEKARRMTPEQVIAELKASGLRGRGGAGFPTGLKWELARKTPAEERYIICNADEGEVGTFKDRYILERDPYTLFEGITIAAHAVGSRKAFIYLRGEYAYLLKGLEDALSQTREGGYLGDLDIEIRTGAGAYICGEESALMDSLEGKRGEVRYRPPFPPVRGLWDKPTIINNVETLMNVPSVLLNGAAWFAQTGTEKSKGTKVFSVAGDVTKPGVYELVMGSTLRELVEGLAQSQRVKMIQIGGATGRVLPSSQMDTPLTYETVLGAGAVTVYDESRDVIEVVYRTMEFLYEESCGKCTPCREGTAVMLAILERFHKGEGREADIAALGDLSSVMSLCSLCGLGQAAPNPVADTLQHFRSEYDKRIPIKAGVKA